MVSLCLVGFLWYLKEYHTGASAVAACAGCVNTSAKCFLEGQRSHYSHQGLDMVLFCTAMGKSPSCGYVEGDALVCELQITSVVGAVEHGLGFFG